MSSGVCFIALVWQDLIKLQSSSDTGKQADCLAEACIIYLDLKLRPSCEKSAMLKDAN